MTTNNDKPAKVVLSYGMGVDSTAILVRWLTDPSSRDFDLSDLVVITAQVGDEFPDTQRLVEEYMLPLMREHGVRYVQLSRKGPREADGIEVHDDTTEPTSCFTEGGEWTLYSEMTEAGTVPQFRTGARRCSLHFKGWPLDTWLRNEFGDRPYRHVMGFNAEEQKRIDRDNSYSTEQRQSEYPLLDWKWGRKECEDYLESWAGEPWKKSCCTFCPFACNKKGIEAHLERLAEHPVEAADVAIMERVSTALNPRQTLYSGHSIEVLLEGSGDHGEALRIRDAKLSENDWTLYRIRRAFAAKCNAAREVKIITTGERFDVEAELAMVADEHGLDIEDDGRSYRVWLSRKGEVFPCPEEVFVVAPALAREKVRKGFDKRWAKALAAAGGCAE